MSWNWLKNSLNLQRNISNKKSQLVNKATLVSMNLPALSLTPHRTGTISFFLITRANESKKMWHKTAPRHQALVPFRLALKNKRKILHNSRSMHFFSSLLLLLLSISTLCNSPREYNEFHNNFKIIPWIFFIICMKQQRLEKKQRGKWKKINDREWHVLCKRKR